MEVLVNAMQIQLRDNVGWQALPDIWPVPARKVLAARGISSEADLQYPLEQLPKPDCLLGLKKATDILQQAIAENWSIMIVADYDADGATSCALAIRGLKAMGASVVSYIVPSRFDHGYGLSPGLVAELVTRQQVDLIITVDNGIASIGGVKAAQAKGIKVIITDHHLPGEQLPKAEAIVNPNLVSETFPSGNIAGVGVCFYLLLGLRQTLRAVNWFESRDIKEPNLLNLIDLVALGTVADVVKLDRLNRTLVSQGLTRIKKGRACEGIKALLDVAGRNTTELVAADLGFFVGPRLNAAGRLEDMSLGIELLLTDDPFTAKQYAQQLDVLNIQRREMQNDMQAEALAMLEDLSLHANKKPYAYCLFQATWHQGIVGLLASKIKERYYRPCFVFAPDKAGMLKGSGRSINGIHIRDVLAQIDSEIPGLITKFGGHAMAAGLSLKVERLAEFEQALETVLTKTVDSALLNESFVSDGQLTANEINLDLAEYLSHLAPWGQGFAEPKFHGEFLIEEFRAIGQQQNHLRLTLVGEEGECFQAIAFSYIKPDWLVEGCRVIACYKLAVNMFRDTRQLQLLIEELILVN